MTNNIVRMVERPGASARSWTAEDVLRGCISDIEAGKRDHPKVMVLWLDDRNGTYITNFTQNVGRITEMISLLEVMKANLLQDMNLR